MVRVGVRDGMGGKFGSGRMNASTRVVLLTCKGSIIQIFSMLRLERKAEFMQVNC